jgi:hypothetical protein
VAIASAEGSPQLTPAPRGRRTLGGIIDAATIGGASILYTIWTRRGARGAGGRLGGRWQQRVLNSVTALVYQQLGSPGAWILGLRTVDSRTGRRLALWRSLAVVLAAAAIQELRGRAFGVRTASPPVDQAEIAREMQAIRDAHPDDPDARNHAMMSFYRERKAGVAFSGPRALAGIVGATLANQWLRRRLAPTVVVSRRSGSGLTDRKSGRSRRA